MGLSVLGKVGGGWSWYCPQGVMGARMGGGWYWWVRERP